ncbi:MAG: oxidoreductase [Gemmatimonadota bacterium]|nr:oxidoreductase [Gemmatimonadota bacterium]
MELIRILKLVKPIGLALMIVAPAESAAQETSIVRQISNTDVLLQAVSAVDASTVWVGGHQATVLRTIDGGVHWEVQKVPGPDSLQIRDVHGVSATTAFALAAGPGSMSRIFRTDDGGATWTAQFENEDPDAFYDCFDFWDEQTGLVMSDAVSGDLIIRLTRDGGENWIQIHPDLIPDALDGEGGFAASGTCLVAPENGVAFIGTGVGAVARLFRTEDFGNSWSVFDTPIVARNEASGIASLIFFDGNSGFAFGGDIGQPEGFTQNAAATLDGGASWRVLPSPTFPGAIYGAAAAATDGGSKRVIVVGPGGAAWSLDSGQTWNPLSPENHWAVAMGSPDVAWMVGPGGRISAVSWGR